MDTSKLFAILSAFLLLICLTFSLTSLTVLRNTVDETDARLKEAEALIGALNDSITDLEKIAPSISVSVDSEGEDIETDILYNRFWIKETGGKIGVYSEEGYLIRLIETDVSTLPKAEREALGVGISVSSWSELIERIQDYE